MNEALNPNLCTSRLVLLVVVVVLPRTKRVVPTVGAGSAARTARPALGEIASSALSAKTWSSTGVQEK